MKTRKLTFEWTQLENGARALVFDAEVSGLKLLTPILNEIRLISHGDKYEAARLVIPRDKLDEVISALAAIILPSDKLAELVELVGALGKVRSSIYEKTAPADHPGSARKLHRPAHSSRRDRASGD